MLIKSLRAAIRDHGSLQVPGAFSGLVGRIAAEHDFKALYVSGGAITANSGQPDIGMLSLPEFCSIIHDVARSSGLPVIADADVGFGEGEMVVKTICEYWRAGATACHIEDQVFPKRCGHLTGKTLVSTENMVEKIKKAAYARDTYTNGEFIVCARTDARSVEGLEGTLTRARAYIDAGADMIFPEGLETAEEFATVASELKGRTLLLANMTEFGKTPMIQFDQFQEWGYSVVIYPVSSLRIAMHAVSNFFGDLKSSGGVETSLDKM
jgi:methylisocitrate lyase